MADLRNVDALVCREAADYQDVVVLPHTWESYFNITHQTLEMCRMAAIDPSITHLMKVDDDSYVHIARLLTKVKKLPREKLFWGHMEKAGMPAIWPGPDRVAKGEVGHVTLHTDTLVCCKRSWSMTVMPLAISSLLPAATCKPGICYALTFFRDTVSTCDSGIKAVKRYHRAIWRSTALARQQILGCNFGSSSGDVRP